MYYLEFCSCLNGHSAVPPFLSFQAQNASHSNQIRYPKIDMLYLQQFDRSRSSILELHKASDPRTWNLLRRSSDVTSVVQSMVAGKVLLRGPLYSVIVLLIIVLVFLRDSPIGIVSLSMMSSRDGFPDIIGRRFSSLKLPFNKRARMMSYFS